MEPAGRVVLIFLLQRMQNFVCFDFSYSRSEQTVHLVSDLTQHYLRCIVLMITLSTHFSPLRNHLCLSFSFRSYYSLQL